MQKDAVEKAPERAFFFKIEVQADSQAQLCRELESFARRIERGEVTTGCMGGPDSGAIYEYRENPEQTHDRYFEQSNAWLRAREARIMTRRLTPVFPVQD